MRAEAQAALDAAATRLGDELGVDGPALLHEREQLLGLAPQGTISAGGTCRLLPTADRWMALNLSRADDVDAVRSVDGPTSSTNRCGTRSRSSAATITAVEGGGARAAARDPGRGRDRTRGVRGSLGGSRRARRTGGLADAIRHRRSSTCPRCGPDRCAPVGWCRARRTRAQGRAHRPPRRRARRTTGVLAVAERDKEERHLDLGTATGRAELANVARAPPRSIVSAARPRALANLGLDPTEFARRGGGMGVDHGLRPRGRPLRLGRVR